MTAAFRHTKIIATLGPASEGEAMLGRLLDAGVDVLRLNMAHASHDWTRTVIRRVRALSARQGREVAVMMDIKGPEIRTGTLPAPLQLREGDPLDLVIDPAAPARPGVPAVPVNYPGLVHDVPAGAVVLVDNGLLRFHVEAKDATRLTCRTLLAGELGSRRHINLPGVRVSLPSFTEKDRADTLVGIEEGIDFLALSFVRAAEDLESLRRFLEERRSRARIIAKIEDQSAITNLDAIIEASDGLMVARGDLGIECPFEELPVIQRRAVRACLARGRPVIVATHMLESMITQPVPTRAEITDVAHAVFEQADAVMLSGETTVGRYPVECVRMLDGIARRIERETAGEEGVGAAFSGDRMKVLHAAVTLARQIPGARLVTFTRHGFMAQGLAALRPGAAPIIVFTPVVGLLRQLRLLRGVEPHLLELSADPNDTVTSALAFLRRSGRAASGDKLVIATDIVAEDRRVDSVQLRTLA